MRYEKIYKKLIDRGRMRGSIGASEIHHIVPECMGGNDSGRNLCALTYREHFVAHLCLRKMFPKCNGLLIAVKMMAGRKRYNSRGYEWAKSVKHSPWNKGLRGKELPYFGRKRPGVGGRKKGCKGKYNGTVPGVAKMAIRRKQQCSPSFNLFGWRIKSPEGFVPFDGVAYSGLVPCLRFDIGPRSVVVSKKHKFAGSHKVAKEYIVGDTLFTDRGIEKITSIVDVGKRQVYDVLASGERAEYFANGIIHKNCQFVVDKTKAIIPEWTDDLIGELARPEWFGHLHRYVAMDLGVKVDLTALIWSWREPRTGTLVIEDEADISGPEMNTLGLVDLIKKKEQELWANGPDGSPLPPYRRISDNNNPLLLQDLGSLHGIHFIPTNKDELHAMINEVRVFIRHKKLLVHPRCIKLIGCLRYGIWNNKRDKFDRSPLYGHFDHLAALVYLIRNLDQVTDPSPEMWDFRNTNPDNLFKRPSTKVNKATEFVKKMLKLS